MYKLIILIEPPDDMLAFEESWPAFLRQAESMPGLVREATIRVHQMLYGDRPIHMIHELFFPTRQDLHEAMASPQGQSAGHILQDITAGQMTLLIAEHREDALDNIRKYTAGQADADAG